MSQSIWTFLALALCSVVWLAACSEEEQPATDDDSSWSGDDDDADDDTGDDDDTTASGCVDVWVTWLQEVDASQDVVADWSNLTEDAFGAPFYPETDVTQVSYAFLWLTAEEARQGMCDASLLQSDLAAQFWDTCDDSWGTTYPIDTSAYAGDALAVSLFTGEVFRTIAIADVVAGSANRVLLFEDGGAVAP